MKGGLGGGYMLKGRGEGGRQGLVWGCLGERVKSKGVITNWNKKLKQRISVYFLMKQGLKDWIENKACFTLIFDS